MYCALTILAERSTLTLSAQTTLVLRQALDRTMSSMECQRRLRQHTAQRTHATWVQDTMADRAVERMHEEAATWAIEDTVEVGGAE
jgi:hypothetical protein